MIHIDGETIARLCDDLELDRSDLERCATRTAADVNLHVPPAVQTIAGQLPGHVAKAEREGDLLVEDTPGRLLAEVLGVTPADIGENPPELPHSWGESIEVLRSKQRRRLLVQLRGHEVATKRRRRRTSRRVSERA